MAGDEAQTVRPTDFEWGWLSDLLHTQLATPSDYKLSTNLRSPRRIASLVNRVWDLYSHVQKSERPSGTGYAEIEDDATDQILYCTGAIGPELNELLSVLSAREGLALITLEDKPPDWIPEALRKSVLTVPEAKGLDFHSVCVLDAGRHLDRVMQQDLRLRPGSGIEGLRKRLAIDQLRVALSRPAERLIWLDISPSDVTVRKSIDFLNGGFVESGVSSCVPAALIKTIEEDELDLEERIQRCQSDARQFLHVKPELAWSRAQQAVTLLGPPDSPAAVLDIEARNTAYLTLAEICFSLGTRNVRLAPELGRPNLFEEASRAALHAGRFGLSQIIAVLGRLYRAGTENHLVALQDVAHVLPRYTDQIEPWLLIEIGAKATVWAEDLEAALVNGHNAGVLLRMLPPFYEVLGIPNRATRCDRLQQRALQLLLKEKQFATALMVLRDQPVRQPALEAQCLQGIGDFAGAASAYVAAGDLKNALTCYRSVPDVPQSLKLLAEMNGHPAADSLQWMARVQQLVTERPEKFTKMVTPAEKKMLEELLERALGVTRRKPVPRKKVTKTLVPRKPRTSGGKGEPSA